MTNSAECHAVLQHFEFEKNESKVGHILMTAILAKYKNADDDLPREL